MTTIIILAAIQGLISAMRARAMIGSTVYQSEYTKVLELDRTHYVVINNGEFILHERKANKWIRRHR